MFLVLWSSVGKKTALLVFSALGLASAKTKCAVCAWAFQYAAQRDYIWQVASKNELIFDSSQAKTFAF